LNKNYENPQMEEPVLGGYSSKIPPDTNLQHYHQTNLFGFIGRTPRKTGLNTRAAHMGFVAMERALRQVLRFSLSVVIPPVFYIYFRISAIATKQSGY
jgi:hypothetical protein